MSFETIHEEEENGQGSGYLPKPLPEDDALLLPKFIDTNLKDLQSTLVPFVAEIFLMVKLGGTRKTAKFLSVELGRKMSRTPIETLMARVRKGELIVTQEDLERASTTHPLARKFVQKAPWLVDPQSKVLITPEIPVAKPKARRGRPSKKKETPQETPQEALNEAPSGSGEPIAVAPAVPARPTGRPFFPPPANPASRLYGSDVDLSKCNPKNRSALIKMINEKRTKLGQSPLIPEDEE